jgi:predicted O-methyltransferase YrrM
MRVLPHFLLWQIGLAKPETQTSSAERDCLARHAAGKKRLVEIGVWHGVTSCRLRSAMAPDGLLLGVDPYPTGRLGFSAQRIIAHREVNKVSNGTMRWIRSTGVEAARQHAILGAMQIDFIFIDGDHSFNGLRDDWEAWSSFLETNGIIALHDSCSSLTRNIDDAGSVRFTQEVIKQDQRFELIEIVDTLTVLKRIK